MKIKGVVFDFNGTLFYDTHLHNQAWDIFLKKHIILRYSIKKTPIVQGSGCSSLIVQTRASLSNLQIEVNGTSRFRSGNQLVVFTIGNFPQHLYL